MFQELLVKIARELEASHIPYMIIGGQAVLLYGEPRLTKDIDITLGAGTDKLSSIVSAVNALGLEILVNETEDFVKKTMVLPVQEKKSGIRVDLIFSFSAYEQQAIGRSKGVALGSEDKFNVRFAALEDIVIHKVIAGRPRDIEDVKSILLKNPVFDSRYIEYWLKEFDKGLETQYFDKFKSILTELG